MKDHSLCKPLISTISAVEWDKDTRKVFARRFHFDEGPPERSVIIARLNGRTWIHPTSRSIKLYDLDTLLNLWIWSGI